MAPENIPAVKKKLTPAQKEAIAYHEGPLLIIAGPGSGKTEVISQRAAYLITPADVISEDIHGPYGYTDDIYFCTFIANEIRKRAKDPAIIEENWEGEGDIWELIEEVLRQEKELIEDNKELILNYTGCSELLGMLDRQEILD